MELKTIKNSPRYFEKCLNLIEDSFSYPKEHHYIDDFYLLLEPSNWENLFFCLKDDKVVATFFTRPNELNLKEIRTPSCFIGGLSVSKEYQGQGILTQIFETLLPHLDQRYALYFLWSDLKGLYNKFSFYEIGEVKEYSGNSFQKKKATQTSLHQIDDKIKNQIIGLYESSHKNLLTPKREWKTFFEHQTMKLWYSTEDNRLSHYWISDKGADLAQTIHECSHYDKAIAPLNFNGNIWTPLNIEGHESINKYLGFSRIGNNLLFNQFLASWSDQKIISYDIKQQEINLNGEVFQISQEQLLLSLFGPSRIDDFKSFNKSLWIPGFESI